MGFSLEAGDDVHPMGRSLQPGLRVITEIGYHGDRPEVQMGDVVGHLSVVDGGQDRTVAHGHTLQGRSRALEKDQRSRWRLRFLFPRSTLQTLEETRDGDALTFNLEVAISGAEPPNSNQSPSVPMRETVEDRFTIARSVWVDRFLPQLGYGDTRLWEARFPKIETAEALERETDHLEEAVRSFNMGEHKSAVQLSRQTIEGLKNKADKLDYEELIGGEEWARAVGVCDLAMHPDAGRGANVTRADAEFALQLARALHRRVASELGGPPRPH